MRECILFIKTFVELEETSLAYFNYEINSLYVWLLSFETSVRAQVSQIH